MKFDTQCRVNGAIFSSQIISSFFLKRRLVKVVAFSSFISRRDETQSKIYCFYLEERSCVTFRSLSIRVPTYTDVIGLSKSRGLLS